MKTTHNKFAEALEQMSREFEKGHLGAHRSKYRKVRTILARMHEAQDTQPRFAEVVFYFGKWARELVRRAGKRVRGIFGRSK